MDDATGVAHSTRPSQQYLYTASLLRRALANGGNPVDGDEALQGFQATLRENSPTRVASVQWLQRSFEMFLDPQAARLLLGDAVDRLPDTLDDLLWLLECHVEYPETAQPGSPWFDRWRDQLPAALRNCLDATPDSWTALWQRARAPHVPPAAATNASGTPAPQEDAGNDSGNELLEAFVAEMDEGLRRTEELLLQFEQAPDDRELLHALFRQYHTLKGAASAVDLNQAAAQLHEGESLLQALRDGELELPPAAVVDFFLKLGDSVRALVDEACGRRCTTAKIHDLDEAIASLLRGDAPPIPPQPTLPAEASAPLAAPRATPHATRAPAAGPSEFPQLRALRAKVARGQLDPELLAVIEALEQRAEFFSAMAASLQAEVQQLRTVPADAVLRRLARPVRDAARTEGKQVRLRTSGAAVRIPKDLVDPLTAMLLHLVRNCVAHGIEPPDTRIRCGKPPEGCVQVEIEARDGSLHVSAADDGRGLDYDAIRKKAVALGWLAATASTVEPKSLTTFLFRPGFSTREVADELAGRGVGLDVVASEVHQLGGRVDIRSTPGSGTRVDIVLPTEPQRA